ncbi:hypothetical protein AgCh_019084 [Apium graveolens]
MELTVLVQSSDGQVFEVEKKPILMSVSIAKELLSRPKSDHNSPIVLHQIDGKTLNKVIEYCKHHCVPYSTLEDEAVIDSLNAFDAQFVDVDPTTFFYDLLCNNISDFFLFAGGLVYLEFPPLVLRLGNGSTRRHTRGNFDAFEKERLRIRIASQMFFLSILVRAFYEAKGLHIEALKAFATALDVDPPHV